MKIIVIDAQGGGVGRMLIEQLKTVLPGQAVTAVGTNAAATQAMLRAGASQGATGENAVRVCAADADLILAPLGMLLCDAMLGEVTAEMVLAIGRSPAHRILLPVSRCGTDIAGFSAASVTDAVSAAAAAAASWVRANS